MSLYDSTFSITVWRLYGGPKGLVMWYSPAHPAAVLAHMRQLVAGLGAVFDHDPLRRGVQQHRTRAHELEQISILARVPPVPGTTSQDL